MALGFMPLIICAAWADEGEEWMGSGVEGPVLPDSERVIQSAGKICQRDRDQQRQGRVP
jgi:hypothetical protein